MGPGDIVRIESKGSVWFIDEGTRQYLRMPKQEMPRDPRWSLEELSDLQWHAFRDWWVSHESFFARRLQGGLLECGPETLVIRLSECRSVYAPEAHICGS